MSFLMGGGGRVLLWVLVGITDNDYDVPSSNWATVSDCYSCTCPFPLTLPAPLPIPDPCFISSSKVIGEVFMKGVGGTLS